MRLSKERIKEIILEEIETFTEQDSPEVEFKKSQEEKTDELISKVGPAAQQLAKIVMDTAAKEAEKLGPGFDAGEVKKFLLDAANKIADEAS